jgi:N-acetylglucosamine kinase-like BadF-type ATPase
MAVDEASNILFQGQSGAANLVSTPPARLSRNLSAAVEGCPRPTHICGCFAGLINEEVRRTGIEHLKSLFPEAYHRAEPDYTAALYACPEETDLCVISGTGSLVCSRSDKQIHKSGGRGFVLGDEGSAFQFGREALIYFLDHRDSASGALAKTVAEIFSVADEGTIVASVYKSSTPATILAKLAKPWGQDAANGEKRAIESLERNLSDLAGVVEKHVAAYRPGDSPLRICLAGGLWKGPSIYRETFERLISKRFGARPVEVVRILKPPVQGAVELAKEMRYGN